MTTLSDRASKMLDTRFPHDAWGSILTPCRREILALMLDFARTELEASKQINATDYIAAFVGGMADQVDRWKVGAEESNIYLDSFRIIGEFECSNCWHPLSKHLDKHGCEFERADVQMSESEPAQAMGPCGCRGSESDQKAIEILRKAKGLQ